VPAARGKTGYWAVVMVVSIWFTDRSVHRSHSGSQPPGFRRALAKHDLYARPPLISETNVFNLTNQEC
jgi:hypothetical protein